MTNHKAMVWMGGWPTNIEIYVIILKYDQYSASYSAPIGVGMRIRTRYATYYITVIL